jgi:cell division protein FtsW
MLKNNSLLITILSLLGFGVIFIANSTIVSSENLYGSPYRFAILQLAWVIMGLAGFLLFYFVDYRKLEKFSTLLFLITVTILFTLSVISIFPCNSNIKFAPCINGANRWLYLNPDPLPKIPFIGVLGFQPAEIAKLALILFLAFKLGKGIKDGIIGYGLKGMKKSFLVYVLCSGLIAGLVLLQPNMSTAAMLFILGTIIYFSSGASLKELFILIPSLTVLAVISIFASPYRRERFMTLLGGRSDVELSSGYHIKQILLALGSGGFWGVGFGQSKQKFNYLPEVASDSIFAIIGEEFGFLGTTLVTMAFVYLIYKGFSIAKNSKDPVGRLIAVGVSSWIGLQFFVNVAAMTKIIPLTGVPIPLISYGGSSMLFSMMALGILANIERQEAK